MFSAAAIIILFYHFSSTLAFCHIHAATPITKYMMLHSEPTSILLINHMIDSYSKQSGVPVSDIKGCIESKKKALNETKPKPKPKSKPKPKPLVKSNLRSNKK